MRDSSALYTLNCSKHAAERAAATCQFELARGTTALRAIACTAPLLGMFGSALLMMNVLRALSLPGYWECDCAGGPAETFVPLMLSVPVAIFACGGLHYLRHRLERFDLEMRLGSLRLINDLVRQRVADRH